LELCAECTADTDPPPGFDVPVANADSDKLLAAMPLACTVLSCSLGMDRMKDWAGEAGTIDVAVAPAVFVDDSATKLSTLRPMLWRYDSIVSSLPFATAKQSSGGTSE
jgi:hypothetical protein